MIMPFIVATCLLAAVPERGVAGSGGYADGFRPAGDECCVVGPIAGNAALVVQRAVPGRPDPEGHGAEVGRGGVEVPVALGLRARLLGLSHLDREEAGPGLLIPRCARVHTFGMRFALDLVFLDGALRPLAVRRAVPPGGSPVVGAAAVLELPSREGGRR